jgi:hypothetical protein
MLTELGLVVPQGETKSRIYLAGPKLVKISEQVREKTLAKKPAPLFSK